MYNFSDFEFSKFTKFFMPFLKPQGKGVFKFCITFQCHER